MGGKDVVAHIKAALAASSVAVDDEVSDYVADMANELLADGDDGRGAEEMVEELVEAAGPMLGEFIADDSIRALFRGAVAHFMGGDGAGDDGGGDGDGGDGGAAAVGKREYCLNLDGIILAFAGKILLRPTALKLEKGHRYGVVGQNGAGKTTLLTRLAAGDITGFPPGLRCVFVQHEVLVTLTDSILDFLTSQASSLGASEADVRPCLEAVGFTRELMGKTVAELSGGWRMRLAIARAMLQKADLLLLDEPTNHLDVGAVEWLASHLNSLTHTTVLVVSHDYDFLTDVATDIVHFEDQSLTTFGGGFPGFRKERPNLVLPRMKRDLVAMIEAQAAEVGLAAEGDGHGPDGGGGGGGGGQRAATALGRGVSELGTRASAYAPSQSRGGLAAAMSGGGGRGGGGVGKSSAKDKPLIVFPDPGQLDGIKNKQQVVLRVEDLSFAYPTSPAPVLDGVNARVYLSSRVAIVVGISRLTFTVSFRALAPS